MFLKKKTINKKYFDNETAAITCNSNNNNDNNSNSIF